MYTYVVLHDFLYQVFPIVLIHLLKKTNHNLVGKNNLLANEYTLIKHS